MCDTGCLRDDSCLVVQATSLVDTEPLRQERFFSFPLLFYTEILPHLLFNEKLHFINLYGFLPLDSFAAVISFKIKERQKLSRLLTAEVTACSI
jgi:hypothetical protein